MDPISALNELFSPVFNVQQDVNIFWMFMKYCFVFAFLLYLMFAIIVLRQVFMMTKTFRTSAELLLKVFAFIHLLFSLGLVILAIVVL